MSRFSRLRQHLGWSEAWNLYRRVKWSRQQPLHTSRLRHPFRLRDNPYDYATFEEVILREAYNIPLPFTPRSIIDGGGNIGLTAAYFATRYPEAQIVSLEPDRENFELLRANTSAYGTVEAWKSGIWHREAHLAVKDIGLGNNGFIVEEVEPQEPGAIRAVSIAGILQQKGWPGIDLLKLDIEGSEKEVFSEGYESWLPRTSVLIVELHDRMKKGCSGAVFAALSRYNFSCSISGENLVFLNEAVEH